MLLGLAADLYALQQANRPGLRPLMQLHNVRALVAWATTVVVAFGTTLSAGLAGGAAAFVIGVLQPAAPPAQPANAPQSQSR
jgi:hypothetical protein